MAITQISKIQIRSGKFSDLPQLSVGELGFATDTKQLFIGNDSNSSASFGSLPNNTEVLTKFSDIPAPGIPDGVLFNHGNVLSAASDLNPNAVFTYDALGGSSGNGLLTVNNINTIDSISTRLLTTTKIQTIDITTGGNTISGNITGHWSLTPGSSIHTMSADVAERYSSDSDYEPGTVMMIGGKKETTIAIYSGRYYLAGIVSSEPAYIMNSTLEDSVVIALIGRVPCKVVGTILKGDLLTISNIPGVATSTKQPEYGAIIGRALESYDSDSVGVIEVKVDRG